jgi:hypothetical protein
MLWLALGAVLKQILLAFLDKLSWINKTLTVNVARPFNGRNADVERFLVLCY